MIRSLPLLQTITLAVLACVCVAMAGLVYLELTWPVAASEESATSLPPATPSARKNAVAGAFSLPPLQSFTAVTDRPLFAQNRRPPAQGSDDAGPWQSLVLAGIIISATSREALILHGKPQTAAHITEGQDVEGWVVTSILPDRIVIRNGSSEHELKLLEKSGSDRPPPPPGIPPRRSFSP
jgi:type II secretory pathway component PulC